MRWSIHDSARIGLRVEVHTFIIDLWLSQCDIIYLSVICDIILDNPVQLETFSFLIVYFQQLHNLTFPLFLKLRYIRHRPQYTH